ncbi:MAG: purine-nucleoside phosphorylase, partial [Actinomycetaceae bacterium]|nr:purine-nucleoside phosphorylase [Actinomycetaceae bacterium]
MATPHNTAERGDFAPAVIMPGDPKRARRIAELLMPDAREVSNVRGIGAYTGTVDGKPLSVMASGMGHPSIGIYATELFKFYGVERIIRVGTTGGLRRETKLGDVIIAIGAHTDSSFNDALIPNIRFAPTASWELLKAAADAGENLDGLHIAPVFSSDHFYDNPPEQ